LNIKISPVRNYTPRRRQSGGCQHAVCAGKDLWKRWIWAWNEIVSACWMVKIVRTWKMN